MKRTEYLLAMRKNKVNSGTGILTYSARQQGCYLSNGESRQTDPRSHVDIDITTKQWLRAKFQVNKQELDFVKTLKVYFVQAHTLFIASHS